MSEPSNASNFTPQGWRTVTPRIVARDARQLVEFVKHVFAAEGEYRPDRPAVLRIGDSVIMISDAGARDPAPAFLYVYVENTDETFQRAVEAGARVLEALETSVWRPSWSGSGQVGQYLADRHLAGVTRMNEAIRNAYDSG